MLLLPRALSQFRLAALALVLLTVVTRLPSLLHPWSIDDEAVYSIVGNEIVDGGRPYVDAVERKPPLLFWLYAGIFEATGKFNPAGLHVVALGWTLATMAGLYVIGRQLFDRGTGLVAALLYSVYQPWGTFKNLAFNGEMIMNLPLVWACAIVFARSSSRLRPELLVAGALLGAAFLLKQPAAIAAVPLGIYLLLPTYRTSRRLTPTASLIHAFLLTAGFFGVLGVVIAVLQKQGILRDAFFWTITAHANPYVFWGKGALSILAFLGCCFPLVVGAILSLRDKRGLWSENSAERTALLILLAASAIGAAAGGRFYPHYYIQLIPPAGFARSALLRADMVRQRSTTSLAAAARHFLRFARSHSGRIFYCKLRRTRFATPSDRGRAIPVREFSARRPHFHLGYTPPGSIWSPDDVPRVAIF